jgi:peptidyl-prolyl cis-trans isomerase SurA
MALLAFSPAQQLVDGIAAIVGEDIILYSEMNQYAFEMAQQNGIDPGKNPQVFNSLQRRALKDMINSKILLLQAQADSVEVNERNIQNTLEQQIQQYVQMAGSEEMLEMYFDTPMKKIRELLYERIKSSMISQQLQSEKFSNISITRPEVVNFYRENRDSIPDLPERIDIDHILMTEKPSQSSKEAAYQRAMSLREDILNDEISFEDAAREYSEDPGSAGEGGDLGFVSKGTFVPEFEKAAFALESGEVSLPVETQFGYHIIKTLEKRGDLIHAKHILLTVASSDNDRREIINMLSTIRDSILEKGNFEYFARKYSDDPDVSANGGHLGEIPVETLQIPEFADVADTLEEGEISTPFKTEYGYHILRLNKHLKAEKISLEDHYPVLENMALKDKQMRFWNRWMDELYAKYYVEIKL